MADLHHRQRQQLLPGRADLDLRAELGADPAVVAGVPAAVVALRAVRVERVLPVLPEPALLQPGVEVVPGQHLVVRTLAGGVPVEVDRRAGQRRRARRLPTVVAEVLAPPVEPTAVAPDRLDDAPDPAV